jgi:hypothetical protein
MSEFFFSARISKMLSSSEQDIESQLEIFAVIIQKLSELDCIFLKWYVNNASETGFKAPLDYAFPSNAAKKYLFNLRKADLLESFLLWNGVEESNKYASFSFDSFGLLLQFKKILSVEKIVQIFKIILDHIEFQYIYLNSYFFADINIFPHRLETTSICYVPKIIDETEIPHLYKKIEINNEFNQGTILIFDENLFDESDAMKKKIQENSIALVGLGLIPEAELGSDFFNDVES